MKSFKQSIASGLAFIMLFTLMPSSIMAAALKSASVLVQPVLTYDAVYRFEGDDYVAMVQVGVGGANARYGYADKTGELIVPAEYRFADFAFYDEMARVQNTDYKWGFINKPGDLVVPCQFETASTFSNGVAIVSKGGKFGYLNKLGELIAPCQFDSAGDFVDGMARVSIGGKFGYINDSGDLVAQCNYDQAAPFTRGLGKVTMGTKYGCVDKSGKLVIPCEYDNISISTTGIVEAYANDVASYFGRSGIAFDSVSNDVHTLDSNARKVSIGGKYGIYLNGELIIPCEYEAITSLTTDLVMAKSNQKCGIVNRSNQIVLPFEYSYISTFYTSSTEATIMKDNKTGYINNKGEIILDCVYESISNTAGYERFPDSILMVKRDGKYGFVDKNRKPLTDCIYTYAIYREGAPILVSNDEGLYGAIDFNGNQVIDCLYKEIDSFSQGVARARKDSNFGFIDLNGQEITQFIYQYGTSSFSEGLAVVCENDKYGYINTLGEMVIPPTYDSAQPFSDGLGRVGISHNYGFIDKTGNIVLPLEYDSSVGNFKFGVALLKEGEYYGYINKQGETAIDFKFQSASSFYGSSYPGIASVTENGNSYYIDKTGASYDDHFSGNGEPWLIVSKDSKQGVLDSETGDLIIPCLYDMNSISKYSSSVWSVKLDGSIGFYSRDGMISECVYQSIQSRIAANGEEYVFAEKGGKFGRLDPETAQLIGECIFDSAPSFSNGMEAVVAKNGLYGIIDADCNTVIDFTYTSLSQFNRGMASFIKDGTSGNIDRHENQYNYRYFSNGMNMVATKDFKYGFVNQQGVPVTPCIYDSANDFNGGAARVRKGSLYGFIDTNGTEFIPCTYPDLVHNYASSSLVWFKQDEKWGIMKISDIRSFEFDLQAQQQGSNYIISGEIENTMGNSQGTKMILIAIYNQDMRLIGYKQTEKTIDSGGKSELNTSVEVTDEGAVLKVFIWDAVEGMHPLDFAYEKPLLK